MLASNGPLSPRRGAWMVSEVADSIAAAHAHGVAHGLLSPENVLLDNAGSVRIIGFCVDAALHGMPPGDPQHDVVDLAGLLHATLTGRWAGVSPSGVPRAPEKHGRVLRPRQVRAGVPSGLDDLCDELLNPRGQRLRDVRDLGSARGIQSFLAEFVGDSTGLGPAIAAGNPEKNETVVLPAVPEILARPHPDDWVPPEPEPEPEPDRARARAGPGRRAAHPGRAADLRRRERRGLLAAGPRRAGPAAPAVRGATRAAAVRRGGAQASLRAPGRRSRGGARRRVLALRQRRSSGSGLFPAVDELTDTREQVPGRNWLRLAMLVAVALVLLVAVAIAFNLGRGKTPLGAEPGDHDEPTTSTSPSVSTPEPSPTPFVGLRADDLDPQGDGEENPDDVGNAVDGDPATSWATLTYKQQLGPSGLKRGVGLVVDLGQSRAVRRVDLALAGQPTRLAVYLTDTVPDNPEELTPVAELDAAPATTSVDLAQAPTGRYLTIWLTALPSVGGGFKGGIVDLVVAG